ncbi:Insulin receptor substrate 2-B [Collichthys lucidus]|uniref:Insulin receptor substrate 2-B n=1 Tax=Collichthys lucidus TaxID=240159 RepID=A0A4U5TY02_COLLU|nr:Insulin receptor substrate 2-B [Collichthys lucidus]
MDELEESCANQQRPPPVSSSPLSSVSFTQTWPPVESPLRPPWRDDSLQSSPPSRLFEELFCSSHAPATLVPLAGALVTSSSSGPQSDVVKKGFLGKLEKNHRRYFVLRAGSHTGPSRLEWYKSQEKFAAAEKSAGKAGLFSSSKQGVIYLRCCLGVSRIGSSRKGHTVALYAKDQTVVLVVEDQWEQEEWYQAIRKLMEEERKDDGEGFDEEDDGYCTLPPAAFFKEVWSVTVKARGLGCSKSLAGESHLCLTATSLILVRVGACSDLPSVTIPLLSVRRFGHLDGSFFLELGRSAPNGPGEIWMEARGQGNLAVAQHIHEVVRETVRALRALPDFSRSPTSNHNQLQTLMASKRCRPKYRDKLLNVRPLGSRLVLPAKNPESPTQCRLELRKPDQTEPESTPSSTPETSCYMEMKTDHLLANNERGDDSRTTDVVTEDACRVAAWEPGEQQEAEEGLGYMMMSPQVSHGSSVLPQDEYVTMASPRKHDWPADSSSSSLQTSFNR